MSEDSTSIDYVMEKASGPHFSGLRLIATRRISQGRRILILSLLLLSVVAPIVFLSNQLKSITSVGLMWWQKILILKSYINYCSFIHSTEFFIRSVPMAAAANVAVFVSPSLPLSSKQSFLYSSTVSPIQRRFPRRKLELQVKALATTLAPPEEIKEYKLPSWATFEMGTAPVFWKTMNGLPPTAGEKLKLFYNPAATKLTPNEEYGVAFNGTFLIQYLPLLCRDIRRTMILDSLPLNRMEKVSRSLNEF